MDLRDRVILITGARRGIGLAIARAAADAGAAVIVHARRREEAESAAAAVGGGAAAVWADLRDLPELRRMVEAAGELRGRLDGLVNNAGRAIVRASAELTEENWDEMFDSNARATFFVCCAALPYLRAAPAPAVVNISSLHAITSIPGRAAYAASKAAVAQLSRGLAVEWAPHGIRVNAVAPGYVRTEQVAALVARDGRRLEERTPLGRLAEPADVAAAVLFLLSEAARHITGVILPVDGGWAAYGGWRTAAAHLAPER